MHRAAHPLRTLYPSITGLLGWVVPEQFHGGGYSTARGRRASLVMDVPLGNEGGGGVEENRKKPFFTFPLFHFSTFSFSPRRTFAPDSSTIHNIGAVLHQTGYRELH